MEGYFIRASKVTPSIYFNPQKGLMDMRGKSSPENPLTFYNYLFSTLDNFAKTEHSSLVTNMALQYFNTSSSKCLFLFLKKLMTLEQLGKKVIVNWYYEDDDDDMKEAGEDLSCYFDYEFNFIGVPVINALGQQNPKKAA